MGNSQINNRPPVDASNMRPSLRRRIERGYYCGHITATGGRPCLAVPVAPNQPCFRHGGRRSIPQTPGNVVETSERATPRTVLIAWARTLHPELADTLEHVSNLPTDALDDVVISVRLRIQRLETRYERGHIREADYLASRAALDKQLADALKTNLQLAESSLKLAQLRGEDFEAETDEYDPVAAVEALTASDSDIVDD